MRNRSKKKIRAEVEVKKWWAGDCRSPTSHLPPQLHPAFAYQYIPPPEVQQVGQFPERGNDVAGVGWAATQSPGGRHTYNVPDRHQSHYSTLPTVTPSSLKGDTVIVLGYEVKPIKNKKTKPLMVTLGSQTVMHSFVLSPLCPVNLMGRDLLHWFGAMIQCDSQGTMVTLPRTPAMRCSKWRTGMQIRCGWAHPRLLPHPLLTPLELHSRPTLCIHVQCSTYHLSPVAALHRRSRHLFFSTRPTTLHTKWLWSFKRSGKSTELLGRIGKLLH